MKTKFYKHIEDVLSSRGFKKIENPDIDQHWENIKTVKTQGQVLIINGQRMEQPAQDIDIKYVFKILGEGSITDEDKEVPIVCTNFSVQEGQNESSDIGVAFYYDDFEMFNTVFSQIFTIN